MARAVSRDFFGNAGGQKMATSSCVCASCLTGKTFLLFPGINDIKMDSSSSAADVQLLLSLRREPQQG